MELKLKYKVISGTPLDIEQTLNLLSRDGWHPVTMASLAVPELVTVILENKPMEESSLKLTTAVQKSPAEEVQ